MSPAAGPIRACKQGDTHMAMTGAQHHAGDSTRPARDRDRPGVRRYRPLGRIGTVRLLRLLAWAVCCAGDLAAFTAASVYAYRAGRGRACRRAGTGQGVPAGLLVPLVTSWSDPGAPRWPAGRCCWPRPRPRWSAVATPSWLWCWWRWMAAWPVCTARYKRPCCPGWPAPRTSWPARTRRPACCIGRDGELPGPGRGPACRRLTRKGDEPE